MTYEKALQALQSAGVTPVIATTSGAEVEQKDCLVINEKLREPVTTGRATMPAQVYLSLNCYGSFASAGKPGNSVASPQGREAKKAQASLEWRESPDGQEWCAKAFAQHKDWFPIDGCSQS